MEKKLDMGNIPDEVLWVWSLKEADSYGNCIGVEMYRKIREVMKKYPEWFMEIKPKLKEELFERSKDLLMFGTGGEMEQGSFEEIWKEDRPSDFLDHVKVKDIPDFQWREHDREFFDMMIKAKEEGKVLVYTRGRGPRKIIAVKKEEEKIMERVRVNRFKGHDNDGLAVYLETEELARKRDSGLDGLEEFESRRFKEEGVRRWRYFHYLYEDRRKEQLDVYRIFDGRLNGRSMTQRVEQRKRKGWWFTEIQRHRAKYIFGIDPYMPEIRREPMDWGI